MNNSISEITALIEEKLKGIAAERSVPVESLSWIFKLASPSKYKIVCGMDAAGKNIEINIDSDIAAIARKQNGLLKLVPASVIISKANGYVTNTLKRFAAHYEMTLAAVNVRLARNEKKELALTLRSFDTALKEIRIEELFELNT